MRTREFLEKLVIPSAAGVVCNTLKFQRALAGRYPNTKVSWLPNGVDRELLPKRVETASMGFHIAHLGTIYGGRDPRPILRALRTFLDRHLQAGGKRCQLTFGGSITPEYRTAMEHEIHNLDLGSHVTLLAKVGREEALNIVARSQLAVVLAQDQDFQVPAKLYELVAINVPTLVVTSQGSASAAEGRRLGTDVVDPQDIDAIVRVFEKAWSGAQHDMGVVRGPLEYKDVARMLAELLSDWLGTPPPNGDR